MDCIGRTYTSGPPSSASSRPKEHAEIAAALDGIKPRIEPFILGRRGFDRSRVAFAVKFMSIARHCRLLHGPNPLADLEFDVGTRCFLAEQALRNLRLRCEEERDDDDDERIAPSVRVSTAHQAQERTVEAQLTALEEAARAQGL